jgi:hypothetical protein
MVGGGANAARILIPTTVPMPEWIRRLDAAVTLNCRSSLYS